MDMNRFFRVFWPWLTEVLLWSFIVALLFAMCGCARVQYVPVETVRIDLSLIHISRVPPL